MRPTQKLEMTQQYPVIHRQLLHQMFPEPLYMAQLWLVFLHQVEATPLETNQAQEYKLLHLHAGIGNFLCWYLRCG